MKYIVKNPYKKVLREDRLHRTQDKTDLKSVSVSHGKNKDKRRFEVERLLSKLKDAAFVIYTCTYVEGGKNKPVGTKTKQVAGQKSYQVKTDLQISLMENQQRGDIINFSNGDKGWTNLQQKKDINNLQEAVKVQENDFSLIFGESVKSVKLGVRVGNQQISVSSYEMIKDRVESGLSLKDADRKQIENFSYIRYSDMLEMSQVLLSVLHNKFEKDGLNKEEKEEIRNIRNKD